MAKALQVSLKMFENTKLSTFTDNAELLAYLDGIKGLDAFNYVMETDELRVDEVSGSAAFGAVSVRSTLENSKFPLSISTYQLLEWSYPSASLRGDERRLALPRANFFAHPAILRQISQVQVQGLLRQYELEK